MSTLTGLDRLSTNKKLQESIKGNIAILCNIASVDRHLSWGPKNLIKIFGKRVVKLFGPQHGIQSNEQDNMVESDHFLHPYFKIPVVSLYSETRIPSQQMLEGIDSIIIDLVDVGTRIYTYIYTLTLMMEACQNRDIRILVLDRPNPIGGEIIEGNILDPNFSSFVGRHPLPVRHAMTIGEIALWTQKYLGIECNLHIIPMENWQRNFFFEDTKLPWVLPSPNLPTITAALAFVGTVLLEGTCISEGRGTTRSLEIIGHPDIEPFKFLDAISSKMTKENLAGFTLRPHYFIPTFNKHQGKSNGGFQIHVTNRNKFRPWTLMQFLIREMYQYLDNFNWQQPPYEYELTKLPIDIINGTDRLRLWVEKNLEMDALKKIELENREHFLSQREECLLY